MKRFLVAFDGGKSAGQAIDFIASRPHYNDLDCHLVSPSAPTTAATRRPLEGAAAQLREAGFRVETEILSGQPESANREGRRGATRSTCSSSAPTATRASGA